MNSHRLIPASLAVVTLLAACQQGPDAPLDDEETLEAASPVLPLAPPLPPLVNPDHADLSPILAPYTGHPGAGASTPGMIAAVVKGKHIVALGAAGYAKIPEMTPMTEDMVFNIGSNTKNMTAVLLSMLIEEHPQLTWSTTLAEALPWANEPGKDYFRPADRKAITLEQLVAQRSGVQCELPDDVNNMQWSHPDYGLDDSWKGKTRQQLLKEYLRGPEIPLNGAPTGLLADCVGTPTSYGPDGSPQYGYQYENHNFYIAQAVIDQWSGMSFLEYAKQKLIDAHGMGTTFQHVQAFMLAQPNSITGSASEMAYWNPYFSNPTHPFLAAGKYSWGHDEFGSPVTPLDPDEDPWGLGPGAGGFAFNMEDWARYAILHMRETTPAWVNVHARPFGTYNFGWSTGAILINGKTYESMCHTGAISGMNSQICVYPELDLAYLSFANGGLNPKGANSAIVGWLRTNMPYKLDTGGCTSAAAEVQRFWDSDMFGCAGSVTYANRASLCAAGYHACSAQEFVANNTYGTSNAEPPKHHYWTNDQLGYGGTKSACWAAAAGGTSCGATTPMRVCSPDTFDPEGNKCNWTGCGFGSGNTTDRHFGGCAGNTTAGTLCCKD